MRYTKSLTSTLGCVYIESLGDSEELLLLVYIVY